jgi:hypothetical protein
VRRPRPLDSPTAATTEDVQPRLQVLDQGGIGALVHVIELVEFLLPVVVYVPLTRLVGPGFYRAVTAISRICSELVDLR